MHRYRIELKWALVFFVMMLAWMLLERMLGWHGRHIDRHATLTNLVAIPATAVYVLALLEKRRSLGGFMSYGEGVVSGLIITLFVTILSPISQTLVATVITPDFFQNMIDYSVAEGKLSRTAAESYFNLMSYIRQGLMGAPLMGVLTSLVVALFVKRMPKLG